MNVHFMQGFLGALVAIALLPPVLRVTGLAKAA